MSKGAETEEGVSMLMGRVALVVVVSGLVGTACSEQSASPPESVPSQPPTDSLVDPSETVTRFPFGVPEGAFEVDPRLDEFSYITVLDGKVVGFKKSSDETGESDGVAGRLNLDSGEFEPDPLYTEPDRNIMGPGPACELCGEPIYRDDQVFVGGYTRPVGPEGGFPEDVGPVSNSGNVLGFWVWDAPYSGPPRVAVNLHKPEFVPEGWDPADYANYGGGSLYPLDVSGPNVTFRIETNRPDSWMSASVNLQTGKLNWRHDEEDPDVCRDYETGVKLTEEACKAPATPARVGDFYLAAGSSGVGLATAPDAAPVSPWIPPTGKSVLAAVVVGENQVVGLVARQTAGGQTLDPSLVSLVFDPVTGQPSGPPIVVDPSGYFDTLADPPDDYPRYVNDLTLVEPQGNLLQIKLADADRYAFRYFYVYATDRP